MTVYYSQYTLGDLLNLAESLSPDKVLEVDNDVFCYRGYYDHVGVGHGWSKAGDLARAIRAFLDEGVMTGYKGGEFPIKKECLVFRTLDHSSTGPALVGFTPEGEAIVCVESWV